MKTRIIAFLAAALFACDGAATDEDEAADRIIAAIDAGDMNDDSIDELDDNIVTQKFVYDPTAAEDKTFSAPAGYGAEDGVQDSCLAPWNNGICWVPKTKTLRIRTFCGACDTDQTYGFVTAQNDLKAYLEARGWSVTFTPNNWNIDIFDDSSLPGTMIGLTTTTANVLDDITVSNGVYRRFFKASIQLDYARLKQQVDSGYYGSCGTTCKRRVYRHVTLHEFGHAIGLGHHTITPSIMKNDWPVSTSDLTYQPFELVYLNNFSAS